MASIKSIVKLFTPPIVFSLIKSRTHVQTKAIWSGDYSSWAEAEKQCTGYDNAVILEKCRNASMKVKNGEAAYERDSVLFDEIQYSWGLLAGLQRAALENNGKLCVLDFGGSLGSSYYQNREFLSTLSSLEWRIVEQAHFVDCGKAYFENEQLKFHYTIDECLAKSKPNVLLLSSIMQYLEKPYDWLEKFIALDISCLIVDRTGFAEAERDILTVQNVPDSIYKASYPAWFFNKRRFKRAFKKMYKPGLDFDSGFTASTLINEGIKVQWEGIIFHK
jgi:putative methyltransferase (TIGR04325 family)